MSSFFRAIDATDGEPTLVLVHGATLNHRMWDAVRRHLDGRYRVLAPDLPGHGARRGEPFALEAAVGAVADAVRSVAPSPVVVAGDSLGGYVTLASAPALPDDQVRGLVLSGCTMTFGGRSLWPFKARIVLNRVLLAVLGERRLLGPGAVKNLVKMGLSAEDAHALIDAGVNVRAYEQAVRELTGIDFLARLGAVRQRVLLVNGSRDKDMMRQHAAFVAAARSGTAQVFEGVEHGVSIRRSEDFAGLVNGFAGRVFAEGG